MAKPPFPWEDTSLLRSEEAKPEGVWGRVEPSKRDGSLITRAVLRRMARVQVRNGR